MDARPGVRASRYGRYHSPLRSRMWWRAWSPVPHRAHRRWPRATRRGCDRSPPHEIIAPGLGGCDVGCTGDRSGTGRRAWWVVPCRSRRRMPVNCRRRGGRAMPSRSCAATACEHSPKRTPGRVASVLPSPGRQSAQMGRPPGVTWAARLREAWGAGASWVRPHERRCKRLSTSVEKGGDGRGLTISLTAGS